MPSATAMRAMASDCSISRNHRLCPAAYGSGGRSACAQYASLVLWFFGSLVFWLAGCQIRSLDKRAARIRGMVVIELMVPGALRLPRLRTNQPTDQTTKRPHEQKRHNHRLQITQVSTA